MKVAIAGAGSVGTAIASDLHASGHEVLVFELDPELVERLKPTLDVTWVAADACEVSSLDAAGLEDLEAWLALVVKKLKRLKKVDQKEANAKW